MAQWAPQRVGVWNDDHLAPGKAYARVISWRAFAADERSSTMARHFFAIFPLTAHRAFSTSGYHERYNNLAERTAGSIAGSNRDDFRHFGRPRSPSHDRYLS
jgi:hypothetical protein